MQQEKRPSRVRVGLIQAGTRRLDLDYNLHVLETMARKAVARGARILCTPECMLDGYSFSDLAFQADPSRYCLDVKVARHVQACKEMASRLGVHVIACMSIVDPEVPGIFRNAALLISPVGDVAGAYYKAHSTSGNIESTFYRPGDAFPVFDVTIGDVATRIGIMICYDRQIPEVARALRVNGAEIIFNPSATNSYRAGWNTRLLQTRAYENKCFVVSVNHAWPRLCGRSVVLNPSGRVVARSPPWQNVTIVELDVNEARAKEKDVATRRPGIYGDLVRT